MGAPPVLLIVSPTGALATPTACAGKLNEIGFTLIWGGRIPIPERPTVCGCARVRSEIVKAPVCTPAAEGSNMTPMEQLEFATSWVVQLLDSWKGPLTASAIEVNGTPPLLVSEIVCNAEVCPTMVPGKASEVAESVSVGGAAPLPLSPTVCVPALSTTVSVPVAGPATVGANSIRSWQSLLAATEAPQAFPDRTNGALRVTLVTATPVEPPFCNVT
jgi:hypothetical protein